MEESNGKTIKNTDRVTYSAFHAVWVDLHTQRAEWDRKERANADAAKAARGKKGRDKAGNAPHCGNDEHSAGVPSAGSTPRVRVPIPSSEDSASITADMMQAWPLRRPHCIHIHVRKAMSMHVGKGFHVTSKSWLKHGVAESSSLAITDPWTWAKQHLTLEPDSDLGKAHATPCRIVCAKHPWAV